MKKFSFSTLFVVAYIFSPFCYTYGQVFSLSEDEVIANAIEYDLLLPKDVQKGSGIIMYSTAIEQLPYLLQAGINQSSYLPNESLDSCINLFPLELKNYNDLEIGNDEFKNVLSAIKGNCLTIGKSIFCDYDYLVSLRYLSRLCYYKLHYPRSNYFRDKLAAHMDITIDSASQYIQQYNEMVYLPLTRYELKSAILLNSNSIDSVNREFINNVIGYSDDYGTSLSEGIEKLNIFNVITHEISHIAQNRILDNTSQYENLVRFIKKTYPTYWNIWIKDLSEDFLHNIAFEYLDFSCQNTTDLNEIYADIYSAIMSKLTLNAQIDIFDHRLSLEKKLAAQLLEALDILSSHLKSFGLTDTITPANFHYKYIPTFKENREENLDTLYHSEEETIQDSIAFVKKHGEKNYTLYKKLKGAFGWYVFLRSLEYELIYSGDVASSLKLLEGEPDDYVSLQDFEAFYNYHLEQELNKVIDKGIIPESHVDDGYRVLLLIKLFKDVKHYFMGDTSLIWGSSRLLGFIAGRLSAIKIINCGLSRDDAIKEANSFIYKTLDL